MTLVNLKKTPAAPVDEHNPEPFRDIMTKALRLAEDIVMMGIIRDNMSNGSQREPQTASLFLQRANAEGLDILHNRMRDNCDELLELVDLASRGLSSLVSLGREPPGVEQLLDPLYDVLETSTTFAERLLQAWDGELGQDAAALVRRYRIR